MSEKIKVSKWDAVEILHDEDDYAGYLAVAFEDGDPMLIRGALADVARARNMSAIARDMGISTRGLYKMLSEDGNPEFVNVQKFLCAIGMRLSVVPANQDTRPAPKSRARVRAVA